MSILAWLSVVLLPTIVIPTTLTFTLSSKPKEIIDGLDKLAIVNRKEKKEFATISPTINLPPAKPAAARPAPAKPAAAKPAPPAPQSQPQPQPQQQQQQQDAKDQKGPQGSDGDSQGDDAGTGATGEQGPPGEPGLETDGPKISIEDIAFDSISRINSLSDLVMSNKGNLLNNFDLSMSIVRLESVIKSLQEAASKAAAPS